MKSKKIKIQKILMKGTIVFLILAMLSSFLPIISVFAEETDTTTTGGQTPDGTTSGSGSTEGNITDEDYIISEDTEHIIEVFKDEIDKLKEQLKSIDEGFNYQKFIDNVSESTSVDISNELQLRALSIYVAEGNDCSGKTFKLTKNIVLTDTIEWNPIGDKDNQFKGKIYGGGHTVSGMLITIKQSYAGFVGFLGEGGVIQNLTISNSKVDIAPEIDNHIQNDLISNKSIKYSYLGGIAGYIEKATITNCCNTTSFSGGNIVGGIVGKSANSTISDCSNSGDIQSYRTAGGIVGTYEVTDDSGSKIDRCINRGTVYAIREGAGGIAGTTWNKATISNCINEGEISISKNKFTVYVKTVPEEVKPTNVGGITSAVAFDADNGTVTIENCINNGKIDGYEDIGGLIGQAGTESKKNVKVEINNCANSYSGFNNGETDKVADEYKNSLSRHIGEFIGYAAAGGATININNCYITTENEGSDSKEIKLYITNNENDGKIHAIGYVWKNDNTKVTAEFMVEEKDKDGNLVKDENGKVKYIKDKNLFHKTTETVTNSIKDKNAPKINKKDDKEIVLIRNNSGFLSKDEIVTILIPFNEEINLNGRNPFLSLKGENSTELQAEFLGIYDNNLVFTYKVLGNENKNKALLSIDKVTLKATVYDVFSNKTLFDDKTTFNLDNKITIVNDVTDREDMSNVAVSYEKGNVLYTISGFSKMTTDGKLYLKKGSTFNISAIFDEAIKNSTEVSPTLTLKIGNKEYTVDPEKGSNGYAVQDDNLINYKFKVEEGNGELKEIYLKTDKDVSIQKGTEVVETGKLVREDEDEISTLVKPEKIYIDSVLPEVTISTVANNKADENRYKAGEDILIKITTSEPISKTSSILPEINVSFSKSGLGKYNNSGSTTVGNAKFMEIIDNKDKDENVISNTIRYRYTIQEGDEGDIQLEILNNGSKIVDIAGNEINISEQYMESDVTLNGQTSNWNPKLNVIAEFYKNSIATSNKVMSKTYFSGTDDLVVVVTLDKELYSYKANIDGKNCERTIDKDNAPILNVPTNKTPIQAECTNAVVESGKTVLTYRVNDIASNYTLLSNIKQINLVNTNNKKTVNRNGIEITATEAQPIEIKIDNSIENLSINAYKTLDVENIITDPMNINEKLKADIYADTTEPRVKIYTLVSDTQKYDVNGDLITNVEDIILMQKYIAKYNLSTTQQSAIESKCDVDKDEEITILDVTEILFELDSDMNKIANQETLEYIIEFDEEVKDFTIEDITVNNGVKGTLTEQIEGKLYTLEVKPLITQGNEGVLQLIIEANTCKDLVGHGNIRQESNITIDKVKPVMTSYDIDYNEENGQIVVNAIFNEALSKVTTLNEMITFGGKPGIGTWEKEEDEKAAGEIYDTNKVRYVYNIAGADGGKAELSLELIVTDVAGNASEKLNITLDKEYVIEQKVLQVGEDEYSFKKTSNNKTIEIRNFGGSTYFINGDVITVIKTDKEDKKTEYICTIDENVEQGKMNYMTLTDPTADENGTVAEKGTVSFSIAEGQVNISDVNIYFDTVAPKVTTEMVANNPKEGIYTTGEEFTIKATTSEEIKAEYIVPEIDVKFEKIEGKFNNGKAQLVDTIKENEKTTWVYRYVVSEGDEGSVSLSYTEGQVTDLAGNTTSTTSLNSIKDIFKTNNIQADTNAPTVKIYVMADLGDQYDLNGDGITNFEDVNIIGKHLGKLVDDDDILEKVDFDHSGLIEITDASILRIMLLANLGNEYDFNGDGITDNRDIELLKRYIAGYELEQEINNDILAKGDANSDGKINNFDVSEIERKIQNYIDRTLKVTNKDKLTYIFEMSEFVDDFTEKDITINGGEKLDLEQDSVNKTYYYMDVNTSIESGNVGDIQLIIEQNAFQDKAGLGNVRTENIIRVDKKAPIIMGLEAHASSDISLSSDIDTIKQYYKSGDKIEIIATFDENISDNKTVIPALTLQFSESGTAKGEVAFEKIEGNKITYNYTITNGDEGNLSIKGFSGEVRDVAGNKTKVARIELNGDIINADTSIPKLNELKVITEEGIYKEKCEIEIEAIYSEEIYALITKEDGTKEIVDITNENAPELKLDFGGVAGKGTIKAEYGNKEDGSVDKTKIKYTYTIANNDNGNLIINRYENKSNVKVCDISGNDVTLSINKTGNNVSSDTRSPEVVNIEAKVENSLIKGTEGDPSNTETTYYKEGNTVKIILTFNEKVNSYETMPKIQIGFSETLETEPVLYKDYYYGGNWNLDSRTYEYSYELKSGDNGYLWVKVPEGQFKDVASNTNIEENETEISNIFADTRIPTLTIYRDTEVEQDGQKITVKATLSENVYDLDNDTRITLTKENAPIMIYGIGETANLEAAAEKVEGNTITYVITKEGTVSGEFYHAYFKGNLYDRAGNPCYENNIDTVAPVLESVIITTNAGKYEPYCKEGTEIYVTATFDEPITSANIKLSAKIGEGEAFELTGTNVQDKPEQVRFTYIVKAGDKGDFTILDDVFGNTDSEITEEGADKTYGYVEDQHENRNNIYSFTDEGITIEGKAIADTENPYIEAIFVNNDEEAAYTQKDGVISAIKTNEDLVEYIIKFNEEISEIDSSKIQIVNGNIKGNISSTENKDELKITVEILEEGILSIIIKDDAIKDLAGNSSKFFRFNAVTVDYTNPEVRFISEYNGGVYVIPTNIGKVEIRPNVEISEKISKIEYKWDNGEYQEIESYSSYSDISIPTKSFADTGTYTLFVRVTDAAGNITTSSKIYKIVDSYIGIAKNTNDMTNQDIIVTITFGEGLTDNRKVTFKPMGSNDAIEQVANKVNEDGGIEYPINKNGTIYVEATDRVGNKVFTERKIENIDRNNPVVDIKLNGADLIIGTEKEEEKAKAVIKTDVIAEDESTITEFKYAYLREDFNVYVITEEQKAKINNEFSDLGTPKAIIENAESTKGGTPYYLYVIAKDIAGNETIVKSNPFTVIDTNERKVVNEESKEETIIPREIEISKLISFEQKGKRIDIRYNNFDENETYLDIIKDKDISLTREKDGYVDYEGNYVEVKGATTITVKGKDGCGNEVVATYEVTEDSIEGPEFDVIGNPENWTNNDVKLEVYCYEELAVLTVNEIDILSKDENIRSNKVISENGDYKFVAVDTYGNKSEKTIKVTKIDKELPTISKIEKDGKTITITATDALSGIKEYAITSTTEVPVEWSKSNIIKTTKDGAYYVWVKDNTGNITRSENTVVISTTPEVVEPEKDITVPEIAFSYTTTTATLGTTIGATITTNEDAIILYSWDNKNWVSTDNYVRNVKAVTTPTKAGVYTLYAKATDKSSNTSEVQTLKFTVVANEEDIVNPEIIFEDLYVVQIDGIKYVKVSPTFTVENLTAKMNKDALAGETPEYKKLASNNKLKTGTEIAIKGETKYIVIVKGDVDCNGEVTFLGDVIMANNYRIGQVKLSKIQQLAADINNDSLVDFISDIIAINNYRLGIVKSL